MASSASVCPLPTRHLPLPHHLHPCSVACRCFTRDYPPSCIRLTLSQSPFAPAGAAATPVTLPVPLLFALTDPKVAADANNHLMHQRAFSFFSTEDTAEVQLGGYDPARYAHLPLRSDALHSALRRRFSECLVLTLNRSILGDMFITPSISTSDYVAVALGLKYFPLYFSPSLLPSIAITANAR